jgi:2-polyprenyl-6-methoxyphenol hydroxylase-like FAD-dependent oxidoreductase
MVNEVGLAVETSVAEDQMIETDVLVIGGGPVGLSLAGDLGWRGIRTMLVEKTDGAIIQPKMDGVNVRTMEFCRRWGLTDNIRHCGYPKDYPQDMVYLTSFDGYELGREEFATPSGGAEERRTSTSPEARFRCPQNMFDPILRDFAASQAGVHLAYECTLESFVDHESHVTARIMQKSGVVNVRAQYLVGCDGANSTVRQQMGIGMSGLGTLTYTTNVLFRCPGLSGHGHVRLGYRYIFVGPEGTWATVVAINGGDLWRLSIIGSKEKVERGEADARFAIDRILGANAPAYEILSIVPWARRELVADAYHRGRVYLAGDAAHVTSPTGGFGMNMGIADAVDLSWKLDAALCGWSGRALLDTYETERRPVALRAVREASGNLLRTLSPKPNARLLEPTYEGARLRYETGRRFAATMLREWYKLGIDLGYVYADSPIVASETCEPEFMAAHGQGEKVQLVPPRARLEDGTELTTTMLREWQRLSVHLALGDDVGASWSELSPQEVMLYTQTAQPGARAPHVWLADGRSTLDWFGRGFVLVDAGGATNTAKRLTDAIVSKGVPLTHQVASAEDQSAIAFCYGAPLTLVRPDGHVAWRGSVLNEEQAAAMSDRIRGFTGTQA